MCLKHVITIQPNKNVEKKYKAYFVVTRYFQFYYEINLFQTNKLYTLAKKNDLNFFIYPRFELLGLLVNIDY